MAVISNLANLDYKKFFSQFYNRIIKEDILSSAAQVAFYFTFALFPLLLFLFSLFGLVLNSADDLRNELFYYLGQIMPSSAYTLVNTTIEEVTKSSSGGKLTIGLMVALWSASAGVSSIMTALNGVYNLKETRPYWKTKLISLSITLATSILIMLALGIVLYGSQFATFILHKAGIPLPHPFLLTVVQFLIILLVLIFSFGLIYNFCPSYKRTHLVWISPGTVVGILLWLLVSAVFRLYLQYFDTYAKTYGSLGAVIILLLWLYLTAVVILIGGLVNSIFNNMAKKTDLKKETNESLPETGESLSAEIGRKEIAGENNVPSIEKSAVKIIPEVIHSDINKADLNQNDRRELQTRTEKPILNLMIGALFGVFFGLFYPKKKDK